MAAAGGGSPGAAAVRKLVAHSDHTAVKTAIATLQTLLTNIIGDPEEPKFRRVRHSNPKIASVLCIPGAVEVLMAFGFHKNGEFYELTGEFNADVAAELDDGEAALAASLEAAKAKEAAAAAAKRAEALKQRELLLKAAKVEQDERRALAEVRRGAPSNYGGSGTAHTKAKISGFSDIGVDLNNCKSG